MRILRRILLPALVLGVAGCGDSSPSALIPSAPSVVPSASIGLQGVVYDSAFRPITGARVEVVDGARAGTTASTDALGRFSFEGTVGERTLLRATSVAHETATMLVPPKCASCATPWLYFYLALVGPVTDMAGEYTLKFVADGTCREQMPSGLQERTYAATIVPSPAPALPAGTSYQVLVGGAPFLATFDRFSLHVAGNYRALFLGDSGPGLLELVGQNEGLALSGWATGSAGGADAAVAATLEGYAHYCALPGPVSSWSACAVAATHLTCESKNHRLVLTRR